MPQINISVTPDEHQKLLHAYQRKVHAAQPDTPVPTFDEWMSATIFKHAETEASLSELGKTRSFDAIEKFLKNLRKHGFGLVCSLKSTVAPDISVALLAHALVQGLKLPPQYLKRLQELLTEYQQDARVIANVAQIGVTNRAYGAITEAFNQLVERTEKAAGDLGEERAMGRMEGGIAILVGIDVMTRAAAHKKTMEFKTQLRNLPGIKETWANKVFGGAGGKK